MTVDYAIVQAVVKRFRPIAEVGSIYYEAPMTFWVCTLNRQYDDGIMDALVSGVEELAAQYPKIVIHSLPLVLVDDPREVVGDHAVLVFARDETETVWIGWMG